MKQISNKEYEEFQKYKSDKLNGHILTPDGLRFIIEANEYDAQKIGQHFKKKIYVDCKEEIIQIILKSETKQQVNNELLKLYSDGKVVSHIYKTIQPLISELPGK